MNKYGGINDSPNCSKKIYNLWFGMLRRCYDAEQHKRARGKAYIGCEVCNEWKYLSCFKRDIKTLPNYDKWETSNDYVLDKDIIKKGNKIYSKKFCCFITKTESTSEMNKRNPQAHGNRKVKYILTKDGKSIEFETEKEACEFLGVKKCTISSSYRYGCKCKGYDISKAKMKGAE